MNNYRYVVQRRYQTEVAKKVGDALGRIFENLDGNSLHVLEDLTLLTSQKPIIKSTQAKLCAALLKQARMDGDEETLSFEVVPYNESIVGKAQRLQVATVG